MVDRRFATPRIPAIANRDFALKPALRMRSEIDEVVAKIKQTIAVSQALMAEADRMIALMAMSRNLMEL